MDQRMDISGTKESAETRMDYDRAKELKAFDDTKAGVKGLVDAGIVNIPKIFIRPSDELAQELKCCAIPLQVPVIDLSGIEKDDRRRRKDTVDEIRIASEKWGFFQVVNHGIPLSVLNEMIEGVKAFHEQTFEVKKEFYSRDRINRVRLESNYDLYHSTTANWRDTLTISMLLSDLDPDAVPVVCRDATIEYIKNVSKLGDTLFKLLSEALGLEPDHLTELECCKGRTFVCHYYPACPEPDLTLGVSKHTDPAFLTVLLQDQIGGLQVLHENQWVDVEPIVGGLVVNIGDFLQIISNDKFKSGDHRALANRIGPRISVACFFTGVTVPAKLYGPIEELISEESPPVYRDFLVIDYVNKFFSTALDDKSGLHHFKL